MADTDTDEVVDQSQKMDPKDDAVDWDAVRAAESNWVRGCDPDDAEAVAKAAEISRMANLGSTGGVSLPYHPIATGGNQDADIVADAETQAEIEGAARARENEKIEQSPQVAPATPLATSITAPGPATNTTPSPDQEGAGEPGATETTTGSATAEY